MKITDLDYKIGGKNRVQEQLECTGRAFAVAELAAYWDLRKRFTVFS